MAAGTKDPRTCIKRIDTSHDESLRPILKTSISMAVHMDEFTRKYQARSEADSERTRREKKDLRTRRMQTLPGEDQ